jgi:tRNA threonylcarbamoyladenosine biosynthesis protein TsaB
MADLFPILAVETSGNLCSVAVILDNKNFIELNYSRKFIHSKKIIDMIDTVLKNAELETDNLKCIAFSMGPGSFTGLRIGLSAVKGIAFGNNLPIIPVPTFNAFAQHISDYLIDGTVFNITFMANSEEVYFAKYSKCGSDVITVEDLKLVGLSDIDNLIKENEVVLGNVNCKRYTSELISPGAAIIGKWAYLFGNDLLNFQYDYLEPNYFKNFIPKVKK